MTSLSPASQKWWRGCVLYQIYPRSYQDTNGDGVGDLKGITQRLEHVASLGVDGIWISPFFRSPMKDFGYDVSDYRDIDPLFGTLDDFKNLIEKAHALNLKVMLDHVWSHTSDQHEWFKESRASRDNPKHDYYVWADPKPDGTAPNNWLSYFGGQAWTFDATRQQYYLHHFLSSQPSLNLWNPRVRQEIKDVAAFWLNLGVDGFRLDVCNSYLYDQQLRDNPVRPAGVPKPSDMPPSNPMSWQIRKYQFSLPENIQLIEELAEFVAQWPDRCLMGEIGGEESEKVAAAYTQTGKRLNLAYSFGLLGSDLSRVAVRDVVDTVENDLNDGWVSWACNNHDIPRVVSRLPGSQFDKTADKARMAMALGLSLRGSYVMYQGEELGLTQAELAFPDLRDPYDISLYPFHHGRDGTRTPMPWTTEEPYGDFTKGSERPWLPMPEEHRKNAVSTQVNDANSVLSYSKKLLQVRKNSEALMHGDFSWADTIEAPLVAYFRATENNKYLCIFNPTDAEANVPCPDFVNEKGLAESPLSQFVEISQDRLKLQAFGFAYIKLR